MQVLARDAPPAREETAGRPPRAARAASAALTLATGLCAALPVIAAAVRALHEGWQPVADRGIIATRSFDVFSSHTPLLGQYSFAGQVTGKLTYSLGPMLYWLLAPAAHVGAPGSFVLTLAIVNSACVVGAVALARRRGGVWLMAAAAVAIGLMCRSLAANNFYDVWNPSAGLFPLLALIFVCWSVACGDYGLLPVAVLLASFELQCEDSFIPPSLAVVAVASVGFVVWWVRARRPPPRGRRRARVWPWVAAAAVVLALCWAPTVIDQVAHEGNLVHVIEAASERKSSLGARVGVHAVVRTVGVRPWWLIRPSDPFVRKKDVLRAQGSGASVSCVLILAWLLCAIALALRRRRGDVAAGAACALMLCLAVYATASATPTKRMLAETLGYTLWSATTIGMFVWLMALWSAVVLSGVDRALARGAIAVRQRVNTRPASRRVLGRGLAAALALGLAALAGALGAAAGTPDEHSFEFAALGQLNSRLGAVPRGHAVFLNARLDGLITPLRPELTYDLRRRGVRPLGNGAYLRTGHWYERAEHPYDYVVWVYDNARLPVAGARVIATAHIRSGGRTHEVWVALSPVARSRRVPSRARPAPSPRRASHAAVLHLALARSSAVAERWSPPARLAGCSPVPARVAFPSEGPFDPTGPGAIVWSQPDAGPAGCAAALAGAPPAGEQLEQSALGPGGAVASRGGPQLASGAGGELAAVGASFGRVAVATSGSGGGELLQARAGRSPGVPVLRAAPGAPLALARAYLGDVAVATVVPGPAIALRVQRYFEHRFEPVRRIPIGRGAVGALTVTLDYRSDVLVAWQQDGAVFAHMLRASGRRDPTQRVGAAEADAQLRALVSDNDHGMVAWATSSPDDAHQTTIYLALSSPGVRFLAPQRVASFADPAGAGSAAGSLQLVRLSTENVLMAWSEAERGHYVVRAAPAVYAATRPAALLSDPHAQAILADLATGPAGEAIAVWRETRGAGGFDPSHSELWAARAFIATGDRPAAAPARRIDAGAPHLEPAAAVDPASDRAVVAWVRSGAHPSLQYAVGSGDPRYHPRAAPTAVSAPSAGTHWLRITAAAVAALAVVAVIALMLVRRTTRQRAPRQVPSETKREPRRRL